MRNILFILGVLVSTESLAQQVYGQQNHPFRLLSLEYFDMGYQKFTHMRDPYVPERDDWNYRASTNFRLAIAHTIYWDNYVHTEAVRTGTVKTVGWHWVLGMRLNKYMDIFHEHHSRHVMEEDRPTNNGRNTFPVEDSYGIKFRLVDDPYKRTLGSWFFK